MRDSVINKYSGYFKNILSGSELSKLVSRIERFSCKIAPLNDDTGNTLTLNRWELDANNPHYTSKDDCKLILNSLVEDILAMLGKKSFSLRGILPIFSKGKIDKEILKIIITSISRLGNLEIPIWYRKALDEGGKHTVDNVYWFYPNMKLYRLRDLIKVKKLLTKIQVSSYLTDRRQTGDYKTNREVRWETHPKSPQFASLLNCMEVEATIISQIFSFVGAPEPGKEGIEMVQETLKKKKIDDTFKCPISGKPIFYNEFIEKVSNPTHGRSSYQVGHMTPLADTGRHIGSNTSWITDVGNRVQGEASLEKITNDIFYMADFHRNRLKLSWKEVEEIAKKVQS